MGIVLAKHTALFWRSAELIGVSAVQLTGYNSSGRYVPCVAMYCAWACIAHIGLTRRFVCGAAGNRRPPRGYRALAIFDISSSRPQFRFGEVSILDGI